MSGDTDRPIFGPAMGEHLVVIDDPSAGPPWAAPTGVSVVVRADHPARWAGLAACVAALANQTRRPDEVIVVVQGSQELLTRATAELGTMADVVASHGRGADGARETGARRAGADVVAFIEDAIPRVDWVEQLIAAYGPDVAGVGGRARPIWDVPPPAWYPLGRREVDGAARAGPGPTDVGPDRDLPSAVMSLRRSVLQAVGGLAGAPGGAGEPGGEPAGLTTRVRAVWPSARLVLEPRVVVEHRIPTGRRWVRTFVARCWTDGRTPPGAAGDDDGVRDDLVAALRPALRHVVRGRWSDLGRSCAGLVGLIILAAGTPARRRAHHVAPVGDATWAARSEAGDAPPPSSGHDRSHVDV